MTPYNKAVSLIKCTRLGHMSYVLHRAAIVKLFSWLMEQMILSSSLGLTLRLQRVSLLFPNRYITEMLLIVKSLTKLTIAT